MTLNPLDIRRQQFAKKTFGGYDTEEVDSFLKQVADQWEGVLDDLRAATDRVQETENKLRHYERVEMALQEALESTRESGRRAEALAEQRARLITDEAEMRARQIVQDAERDRHDLRQDLLTLTSRQAEIGARLRGFLLSELEILAQFQGDDPVGFIKLQPAGTPAGASAESRGLDAPVEPSRLVSHGVGAYGVGAHDAMAGTPRATGMSREVETPAPAPSEPAPVMPAPPEPVVSEPVVSEPVPDVPVPPAPTESADAPSGAPWPELPAAEEAGAPPAPAPRADTSADASPAPRADVPAAPAAPPWPPAPLAAAPGIPTWAADLPEAAPAEPASASWDLRSLVTGSEDSVAGSEAERERIRRILDDLD